MIIYDIELSVPLGIRKGELAFKVQGDCINGYITILGQQTCIKGSLKKGKIEIEGVLKTKVRDIHYVGKGILQNEIIEMQLNSGESFYDLKGYLRKECSCE